PPEKILAPEINEKEKPGYWQKELLRVGERLGADRKTVQQAIRAGQKQQEAFARLTRQGLTTPAAFARLTGRQPAPKRTYDPAARFDPQQIIGVMGHPYILYDFVGHNVVDRLSEYGRVITAEMVSWKAAQKELATIYEGEKLWTYEARLLGAALHLLRQHLVHKMVFVEAFACGPASIIEPYIEEEAERQGIPFLLVTVDEHTGEAGLLTRLEAFVDTARGWTGQPATNKPAPVFIPGERPARLKVGAPSVGWAEPALATVLEKCGVEMLPTPPVTRKTVELGKELAPEFICYPMITTLGQIRELVEAGAGLIVMVGGKGRCRLGWYAQVQELLLKRKGYDFQLVIVDSPLPLTKNWGKFKEAVRLVAGNASWPKIIRSFYLGYLKMKTLDDAEKLVRRKRAYEREPGAARRVQRKLIRQISSANDPRDIARFREEFAAELAVVPEEPVTP
ncbi:MAG: hypothetical protein H5T99_11015, partial [Moorella sp. (in: Bacteria)]|nr:hypothetical protein [Moorella sp. (in: firmicutes)]